MHFLAPATAVLCLTSSAMASLNTTREYYLKTQLAPGQPKKTRFANLYLESYHTGAGENDAVFTATKAAASKGFLNATSVKRPNGKYFSEQLFDLGSDFPYGLVVDTTANFYSSWEPVRVNAGGSPGGYFFNATGLQWNTSPSQPAETEFGGWMVCEWWHEAPQLFMRNS